MKELIPKFLLVISFFLGIGTIYMVIYCIEEPVGREDRIIVTLVWLMALGLFLGLYRIIDLLEEAFCSVNDNDNIDVEENL